ncbi:hypothetical protein DFH06DRAFT_1146643 [Mycena polygramma]|nr:hypothetical protein DFH06DRAFT_1146643 [Mycena polygramma]
MFAAGTKKKVQLAKKAAKIVGGCLNVARRHALLWVVSYLIRTPFSLNTHHHIRTITTTTLSPPAVHRHRKPAAPPSSPPWPDTAFQVAKPAAKTLKLAAVQSRHWNLEAVGDLRTAHLRAVEHWFWPPAGKLHLPVQGAVFGLPVWPLHAGGAAQRCRCRQAHGAPKRNAPYVANVAAAQCCAKAPRSGAGNLETVYDVPPSGIICSKLTFFHRVLAAGRQVSNLDFWASADRCRAASDLHGLPTPPFATCNLPHPNGATKTVSTFLDVRRARNSVPPCLTRATRLDEAPITHVQLTSSPASSKWVYAAQMPQLHFYFTSSRTFLYITANSSNKYCSTIYLREGEALAILLEII